MCAHLMKQYTEATVESTADAVVRKTGERGVQKSEVNPRLEVRVQETKQMNQQSVTKGEEGRHKSSVATGSNFSQHNGFLLQSEYSTVITSFMCYDAGPGSI